MPVSVTPLRVPRSRCPAPGIASGARLVYTLRVPAPGAHIFGYPLRVPTSGTRLRYPLPVSIVGYPVPAPGARFGNALRVLISVHTPGALAGTPSRFPTPVTRFGCLPRVPAPSFPLRVPVLGVGLGYPFPVSHSGCIGYPLRVPTSCIRPLRLYPPRVPPLPASCPRRLSPVSGARLRYPLRVAIPGTHSGYPHSGYPLRVPGTTFGC